MSIIDTILHYILISKRLPYPKTIMIDPVNICQLECPLCSTGRRNLNYDSKIMSFDTFRTLLAKTPFVEKVELFKNGEPFLNPDILLMTKYAYDRNIKVCISTNFSLNKSDEFFENIVHSGLTKLIISLDGASQETYSLYRRGGDYDLVVSNIKRLLEIKNKLRKRTPEIIWQFLVNRFNEHEIAKAESIARDLKITLDLQPIGLGDDLPDVELDSTIQERKAYWLPKNRSFISDCYKGDYRYPLFKGICTQLFTRIVVTADGKVLPCCWAEDKNSVFGDILTESFEDIWYSRKYLNARLRFLKKDFVPEVQTVCSKCINFGNNASLKDKLNLVKNILHEYWVH